MIKISVVTPVLNGEQFIRETVESVLSQRGNFGLEYIVRDGGSTDKTLAIVDEYRDRCTVVSEPDGSPQAAINAGMANATGDILCWLNGDDCYEPGALQRVADTFATHPDAQWAYGFCSIIDSDGIKIRGAVTCFKTIAGWFYSRHVLLCTNFINQPATFWRRQQWHAMGGLNTTYKAAFDYELWLRMATESRPVVIRDHLSRFRRHHSSISETSFKRQFKEDLDIACGFGRFPHRWLHRLGNWGIVVLYGLAGSNNRKTHEQN
jgi:glycosyltransferase involved in cell wall biosynthesis